MERRCGARLRSNFPVFTCWRPPRTKRAWCCVNFRSDLDFPGVRQCFKLTRTRTLRDRTTGVFKTTTGTVCGVTSLPRERADAARLLVIVRVHWGIENKVFHVRDQTPDEDACRVRKWSAPVVPSTLGNSVLIILRKMGVTHGAAQLRTICVKPVKALQAVHQKRTEN